MVFGEADVSLLLQHFVVELFSSPVGGGLDERHDHGMGFARLGRKLGLEQGCDVEAVSRGFDCPNLSLGAASNYREARFHGSPFVFGIDFKVAEELFGHGVLSVEGLQV